MTSTSKLLLLSVVVLLTGCGASGPREKTPLEKAGIYQVHPVEEDVFMPPVGEKVFTAIGDSIVSHVKRTTSPALEILNPMSVVTVTDDDKDDHEYYRIEIPKGVYKITAKDQMGSEYYGIPNATQTWFEKYKFDNYDPILADLKLTTTGDLSLFWMYPRDDEVEDEAITSLHSFKKISIEVSEKGPSLRRELIYTGRSGNSISLLYREFKEDMARPAFSQALQYDISTDKVIGYKNARFRVIDANNTSISYEVLHPLEAKF